MEFTPLNIFFGLVILVALALFMRALLNGSRMLGVMMDRDSAQARARRLQSGRMQAAEPPAADDGAR